MAGINTLTVLYLTGLAGLGQAFIHFGLSGRQQFHEQRVWLAHQVLLGLTFLSLASGLVGESPDFYVLSALLFLAAYLARFIAIASSLGASFTKRSLILSGGIIIFVGILFTWCHSLGAPLGSLETIVLLPLGVASGLTAKYLWDRRQILPSRPMLFIGYLLWIECAVYGVLAIGALAGIGQDYVHPESFVSTTVALIAFAIQLVLPVLWVINVSIEKPETFAGLFSQQTAGRGANLAKVKASSANASSTIKTQTPRKKEARSVNVSSGLEHATQDSHLTAKELEVLRLVASGKKNKEIADVLQISEASMKVHKSRMTSKLGVKTLPELIDALQQLESVSSSEPAATTVAATTAIDGGAGLSSSTESQN